MRATDYFYVMWRIFFISCVPSGLEKGMVMMDGWDVDERDEKERDG